MGYEQLVGKPAPPFTLKNYDGQDYEVKPGANGVPIVLIFYPAARMPPLSECPMNSPTQLQTLLDALLKHARCAMPLLVCYFCHSDQIEHHPKSPPFFFLSEKDRWGPETVQLVGVSKSSVEDQKSFVEKYNLTVRTQVPLFHPPFVLTVLFSTLP